MIIIIIIWFDNDLNHNNDSSPGLIIIVVDNGIEVVQVIWTIFVGPWALAPYPLKLRVWIAEAPHSSAGVWGNSILFILGYNYATKILFIFVGIAKASNNNAYFRGSLNINNINTNLKSRRRFCSCVLPIFVYFPPNFCTVLISPWQ